MNCINPLCKYATEIDSGVICDIKKENDIEIYIPSLKIHVDCPCHSDVNLEETRYVCDCTNKSKNSDRCQYCNRLSHKTFKLKKVVLNEKNKRLRLCFVCLNKFFNVSNEVIL